MKNEKPSVGQAPACALHADRSVTKIGLSVFLFAFLFAFTAWGDNFKALESDLDSRDWKVRLSAVERLDKIKEKKSTNLLIQVAGAKGEYWPVKIKAIQILGERADPAAIETLLDIYNDIFLNSECPAIKSYAAAALGSFKNNEAVYNALITGIDDPELLTKEAVIESLGRLGNPDAIEFLIPLLNDESFTVRHSTIKALANIGDKKAIPYLNNAAEKDKDPLLKEIAHLALKSIR